MPRRIVEIAEDRRYLAVHRGFMIVKSGGEELGRVALDMIEGVIVSGHGVTHSSNLLAALAKRGIPFVVCDNGHSPVGMLLAVDGNYHQGKRLRAQSEVKKPRRKRLWQSVVRAKIGMQAAILEAAGRPSKPLTVLVSKVRSGDPANIESQAARRYWSLLFGKQFRRDRQQKGINAALNFGYTVLRSSTARSIIAAGLHPGLGIHHHNTFNAMALADDLMEPFRPLVDWVVRDIITDDMDTLKPTIKKQIVAVLSVDLQIDEETSPLNVCLNRLAVSLAQCYLGEADGLSFPLPPDPESLHSSLSPS